MADRHVAYALIGGGLAAGNCARWLRESGADGSILLIGREADLPYNRPDCSKGYLQGKASREDTLFRPPEWYDEQLAAQGGGCAICGRPPRDDISLHVDHDHRTGALRGLTCFRCNNALGDFGDDAALIEKAAAYLESHDAEVVELTAIAKARARRLAS